MMYGCIGEHLPHSYSAEIHPLIAPESYVLRELTPECLPAFLTEADFLGINVTIPYKQAVMPYLHEISDTARAIGAVNTIVNRRGRLCGYNTDEYGLSCLIAKTGISLKGRKVLVLGTGGTSRTACYTARALGAAGVRCVSRTGRDGALTYEQAVSVHADTAVIINTTPCGMYPNIGETPLSLESFPALEGVVDVIYNPLRTRLVQAAQARGVPAAGGLYMLVAQAVRAAALFRDTRYPASLTDEIYHQLLRKKENIVLIGMPGSGKTAVGQLLASRLSRDWLDTDQLILERAGLPVPEIFSRFGEAYFRDLESEIIAELSSRSGLVLSTGGGAVLRPENAVSLKMNGRLFFLDRDPAALVPTEDRPLADTREKITKLYEERLPVYRKTADETISVDSTPEAAAAEVESRWKNHA